MSLIASMFLSFTFLSGPPVASQAMLDDRQVVLIANYHATIRAGPEIRQMMGQAKVRDTHQFPIQFDDFRLQILLVQLSAREYKADVVIERLEQSEWLPINTDSISFRSSLSSPTELEWNDSEYSLELAIAVSVLGELPSSKR